MSDQMTQTESSPEPVEALDVFKGQHVSMEEFSHFRTSGELPDRFKDAPVDSSPTDNQEETDTEEKAISAPDSDPEDTQELKPKTAKRIQQLLEKTKELERKLAEKEEVKVVSPSPAKSPDESRPRPTPDGKRADGTSYETYEDYIEDLTDWKTEQRFAERDRQHAANESQRALKVKLDDARARYEDADDVIFPANEAIQKANIPLAVKEVFAQSDLFIDLCYVVGSDPKALKEFISLAQSNPRAAIGKIFDYERGIAEELSKASSDGEDKKPESRKTTAPKPPSPVGGTSTRAFDTNDESLSPEEWMRKRNQDIQKKGR